MRPGKRSDPGIPGCRMQLANIWVRRQRPNNRVLSPARPNHKYAHVTGAYPGSPRHPLSEVSLRHRGEPGEHPGEPAGTQVILLAPR
jgi:hypothetical protein